MTFIKQRKCLILAKYVLMVSFVIIVTLNLSNLYLVEVTSHLTQKFIMWFAGIVFAYFGGVAYFINQKIRLRNYLVSVTMIMLISLLTLFLDKDALVPIGMGGYVFGYMLLKWTINTGPE